MNLAIYYTPGARGDFLSILLCDDINLPTTFSSLGKNYKKFHQADEFTNFNANGYYVIRISNTTAGELIDTSLLHFKKNNTDIQDNFYDRLFIVSKNTYVDELESQKFNYSHTLKFSNFNNVDSIGSLYTDVTGKILTNQHVEYLEKNNELNQKFLLEYYKDSMIIKTLKLLDFEIKNSCLFRKKIFSFDDYLDSNNYWDYFTVDNYIDSYRPR